jgi:cbb3-type cytochrome oxidase cytochrome c subunit
MEAESVAPGQKQTALWHPAHLLSPDPLSGAKFLPIYSLVFRGRRDDDAGPDWILSQTRSPFVKVFVTR